MTIKWDATNDQRLLLAILAVTQKVDYKAIATYFGQDVTSKAISERISKLRKQVGSSVSTSNGANGSALPKKRAAPASTKGVGKGGSPKRSKNVKDKEEEEEEEEILADADETPEAEEVKTEPTMFDKPYESLTKRFVLIIRKAPLPVRGVGRRRSTMLNLLVLRLSRMRNLLRMTKVLERRWEDR
ncbi:hypothetical protein SAICODRAFT_116796 [Saitoella complicata NRRL Y-17804]|uniref:uncharacterized protein n=1 Tax=Saitoella complicata (strain BCRC 22490 / CBS 7301 / JCM 7358 / NBRC 10748 / NRRL Y-17804) TaxID=698492 RepID=UPI000867472B|nr:uncharacterized protein SAICODRAFT_116796 [Saitoella complicata NRRL Y-17804]ODQ53097.1 hypothetical protein SAICODRAFT_116796 [Saitoella complicata NRRL Y-17804]